MSAKQINIKVLPQQFSDMLDQAQPGEEIIVMEDNQPRAKFIALPPPRATKLGLHPGAFQISEDFDEPLPDDFWLGEK